MRVLIQRVSSASVEVENRLVGSIGPGLLLFVGFGHSDSPDLLPQAVRKISEMRVFSDDSGKLNLSLRDIGGQALIVSQFTLYANCSRRRRPDFTPAADPAIWGHSIQPGWGGIRPRLRRRWRTRLRKMPIQIPVTAAAIQGPETHMTTCRHSSLSWRTTVG